MGIAGSGRGGTEILPFRGFSALDSTAWVSVCSLIVSNLKVTDVRAAALLEEFEELSGTSDLEIALPPTATWYNLVEDMGVLDKSPNTIPRRMNKLVEMGLLETVDEDRGYYKFTEKGRRYLSGELGADELSLEEY